MLKQILHYPSTHSLSASSDQHEALKPALTEIRTGKGLGAMPWLTIPKATDDIAEILAWAERFRSECDRVVVCGTGGSSLGATALSELVCNPLHRRKQGIPNLYIVESTDAETLTAMLEIPLERTGWIFVSKSGTTLETMTQFLSHLQASRGKQTGPRLVITSPGSRPLRDIAGKENIPVLDHDPELGGRFSVMSRVGLLPAAIAGVDIVELRKGAASMLTDAGLNLASEATAWHIACLKHHNSTQIVMPYIARLQSWSLWYRQLWAESLGKQGNGSTPLTALGPVDQHSMLQLFLDGPRDKCITILRDEDEHTPSRIQVPAEYEEFTYLNAHTGTQVVNAQAHGTADAFIRRGIPLRHLLLPKLDAESMGQLMMLAMLETALTAHILGINAFDQPAVEEGKITTHAMLNQPRKDVA